MVTVSVKKPKIKEGLVCGTSQVRDSDNAPSVPFRLHQQKKQTHIVNQKSLIVVEDKILQLHRVKLLRSDHRAEPASYVLHFAFAPWDPEMDKFAVGFARLT